MQRGLTIVATQETFLKRTCQMSWDLKEFEKVKVPATCSHSPGRLEYYSRHLQGAQSNVAKKPLSNFKLKVRLLIESRTLCFQNAKHVFFSTLRSFLFPPAYSPTVPNPP